MRFIFNFIFFGLLFFVIWHFFPDAFTKLVVWAGDVYDFLSELVQKIVDYVSPLLHKTATNAPVAPEPPKALW